MGSGEVRNTRGRHRGVRVRHGDGGALDLRALCGW